MWGKKNQWLMLIKLDHSVESPVLVLDGQKILISCWLSTFEQNAVGTLLMLIKNQEK